MQTPSYWAEYRTGRIRQTGAARRTGGQADVAEYRILDGADWSGLEWTGGLADAVDAADYGILDGADWRRRGRLGRMGQTGQTGADGADGADWSGRGG